MSPERLLAHFDRLAEAPDAIPRLRRFILDLAVRGKLVEQDPDDEPASELLKRVPPLEKPARYAKRSPELIPGNCGLSIGNPETPLPQGWLWKPLIEIARLESGHTPSRNRPDWWGGGIPWIGLVDARAHNDGTIFDTIQHTNEQGIANSAARVLPAGTVCFSRTASVGYVVIMGRPMATSQDFVNWVPTEAITPTWLQLVMVAERPAIGRFSKGAVHQTIYYPAWLAMHIVVPPLAEQHRIVGKVDELMALCDRLEAARNERESRRDRLVGASLHRLSQPADDEAFRADARFTLNHLPRLTTRLEHVKQIRQTILNLAVRGKLVEQDSAEEPAPLKTGAHERSPEGLPETWRHVRLEYLLSESTRNGYSRRPDDAEDGVPILRISAGTARQDGIIAEEEHKMISGIDQPTRHQYGLQRGDLLACRFNGNKTFVGRLTFFSDYLGIDPIYPDKLIRVRLNRKLALPEYVRLAGESDFVRGTIEGFCATTVGNWGISASNLKEVPFPLPPLAEQHRIVAKVDELRALCDRLEAGLAAAEADGRRLLEAVLHEALAPTATAFDAVA